MMNMGKTLILANCFIFVVAIDMDVVRRICALGKSRGESDFVKLASIETCIVESGCRNLNHGDRDSLGVFQQRASWGSVAERMNVEISAGKFFDRTKNCHRTTAGRMAQCVQVSAFPEKYDQNENLARDLMQQVGCGGGGSPGPRPAYNEAPCSSVGHCYNRDTDKCSGASEGKVNGKFACPSQDDNIVCCVGGGIIPNEFPCSTVGHCYNRDSEKCNGRSEEKVNGQFACPSQADNIVCCFGGKPSASPGMVRNEGPCSDIGFCFDQDTHSCPTGRSGPTNANGKFVCPTQKDSIICCFN